MMPLCRYVNVLDLQTLSDSQIPDHFPSAKNHSGGSHSCPADSKKFSVTVNLLSAVHTHIPCRRLQSCMNQQELLKLFSSISRCSCRFRRTCIYTQINSFRKKVRTVQCYSVQNGFKNLNRRRILIPSHHVVKTQQT